VTVDVHDPRWFPFDLALDRGVVRFLRFEAPVLDASAFLDHRIALADRTPTEVDLAALEVAPPARPPAWLFHTSFCCSTLLARALHVAPAVEVLKEPFALRRLSDASNAGGSVDAWLAPTVRLLARPWTPGGRVVVKPTHVALNLAPALLDQAPGSRALLLHSGLEDFLVSNCKKTPETRDKVGRLAVRLAIDAGWDANALLAEAEAHAPWSGAVALQWAATRRLAERLSAHAPDRVRVLADHELLADLEGATRRVADWLGLDLPTGALAARLDAEARRHAKSTDVPYDAAQRRAEAAYVRGRDAAVIDRALAWAGTRLLPLLQGDRPGTALQA
jgi:hypothetical protein